MRPTEYLIGRCRELREMQKCAEPGRFERSRLPTDLSRRSAEREGGTCPAAARGARRRKRTARRRVGNSVCAENDRRIQARRATSWYVAGDGPNEEEDPTDRHIGGPVSCRDPVEDASQQPRRADRAHGAEASPCGQQREAATQRSEE